MFEVIKILLLSVILIGASAVNVEAAEFKEITLKAFDDVWFGNVQDDKAKTGVTIAIFPKGAAVGVDISGGGPASRETPVISPTTNPTPVNAIVLGGGSAYGLAASDGVMSWLEEQGIGYDTRVALVPIVVQSDIFDLSYGSSKVRPDAAMGRAACEAAKRREDIKSGSFGAGTGATVGKLFGMARSMKAGLGVYAVEVGDVKLAAIVVVNALGDVYDERNGQKIAGLLTEDRKSFSDSRTELYNLKTKTNSRENTTIGMIVTNAAFDKTQLTKIASMTRNAYARSIKPVGTLADGDTIYAASVGEVKADLNMIGTLASEVMSEAIRRAVTASKMNDSDYLANCWKP